MLPYKYKLLDNNFHIEVESGPIALSGDNTTNANNDPYHNWSKDFSKVFTFPLFEATSDKTTFEGVARFIVVKLNFFKPY